MKFSLMVIDLQKAYYDDHTRKYIDRAVEYINAVLPLFREKGLPVIWVQDADDEAGVVPGVPGFDLIDSLKPGPDEPRIVKRYGNAFNKTECADILKREGSDIVVMTGFSAEYCVLSTYRGALDLDLTPVILRNGIASRNPDAVRFVEEISNIISYQPLRKLLES